MNNEFYLRHGDAHEYRSRAVTAHLTPMEKGMYLNRIRLLDPAISSDSEAIRLALRYYAANHPKYSTNEERQAAVMAAVTERNS